MLPHRLGQPVRPRGASPSSLARHDLWLIEDCCDALGATFRGQGVGTFGDLATFSFYPAHHITMGEGGAVLTDQPSLLKKLAESFRDWGRDCWCAPGADDTCGRRFSQQLGELPYGYDHKYTYSHVGYNLKLTDMQAAVGVAQLDKLAGFVESRKRNFARLSEGLADLSDVFLLPRGDARLRRRAWFGFLWRVWNRRPRSPGPTSWPGSPSGRSRPGRSSRGTSSASRRMRASSTGGLATSLGPTSP